MTSSGIYNCPSDTFDVCLLLSDSTCEVFRGEYTYR